MKRYPLIFGIGYFSFDDGPGIRTTVFLKGCPLSCIWCHNPEGISPKAEILHYENKCISCGSCTVVCQKNAIESGFIWEDNCQQCSSCVANCSAKALRMIGTYYTPHELVNLLLEDRIFYHTSGGGITFSGGEPTLYMEYLSAVLRKLKKIGIHVALETAGTFEFAKFESEILPFVDVIYYDLKLIDSREFSYYTGGDNRCIIENFIKLSNQFNAELVATIPLIPDITSTEHNLTEIAHLIEKSGCRSWLFRPYNIGGIVKYQRQFTKNPIPVVYKPMSVKQEQQAKQIFLKAITR